MILPLFVSCAPELEPILSTELQDLGCTSVKLAHRGVFIQEWTWDTIYQINYSSRLASRVFLPLGRFRCRNSEALYKQGREIDWLPFFSGNPPFMIDAHTNHPEFRNSMYAAQVLKDAICDQIREKRGTRPSIDVKNPKIRINLFIDHQGATISFDTSGEPLHKRGYRRESVEAPLQETLAAAILKIAEYSGSDILVDPCCGSGTLLIEAALIATHTPPGYMRNQWGFMQHPQFSLEHWLEVKHAIDKKRIPLLPNRLFGIDINQQAVRAAKINSKVAGFASGIEIHPGDFKSTPLPIKPNLMVVNPPHGNRLGDTQLHISLYRDLGNYMKNHLAENGRGFIFTSNLELTKEVGLRPKKRHILSHSSLEARLLEFEIWPLSSPG